MEKRPLFLLWVILLTPLALVIAIPLALLFAIIIYLRAGWSLLSFLIPGRRNKDSKTQTPLGPPYQSPHYFEAKIQPSTSNK